MPGTMTMAEFLRDSAGVEYGIDCIKRFDWGHKELASVAKSEERPIAEKDGEEVIY
jgi:hypothetical protein